MDFEKARYYMVQQQVRPWNVLNPDIIHVMSVTPRERFVPSAFRELAFSDTEIPLNQEQVMLSPKVAGRILEVLQLKDSDTVLEIGTGSGYVTALAADLCKQITSVEIIPEIFRSAQNNLAAYDNIQLESADALGNWESKDLYDAIFFTGSMPMVPEAFLSKLKTGGRLFAIVGEGEFMSAMLFSKNAQGEYTSEFLFETHIPQLLHAPQPEHFQF
jgi:protein-L-isoaspartate(D-aspartate) O-methyltransferase